MPKRFDIVLLDADETIFDFRRAERVAFTRTMAEYGFTADDALVDTYSNINLRCWKALERGEITREQLQPLRFEDFFKAIGAPVPDCTRVNARYKANLSRCGYLLPGATEFLQRLHEYCAIYLATNGLTTVQRGRMAGSLILPYIDGVYISEEIGFQKPDKAYFDYIFRDLGVTDRSRVIILGDSLTSDMRGGRNAGITTCHYLADDQPTGSPLCDYEISSYDEFFDIIHS